MKTTCDPLSLSQIFLFFFIFYFILSCSFFTLSFSLSYSFLSFTVSLDSFCLPISSPIHSMSFCPSCLAIHFIPSILPVCSQPFSLPPVFLTPHFIYLHCIVCSMIKDVLQRHVTTIQPPISEAVFSSLALSNDRISFKLQTFCPS